MSTRLTLTLTTLPPELLLHIASYLLIGDKYTLMAAGRPFRNLLVSLRASGPRKCFFFFESWHVSEQESLCEARLRHSQELLNADGTRRFIMCLNCHRLLEKEHFSSEDQCTCENCPFDKATAEFWRKGGLARLAIWGVQTPSTVWPRGVLRPQKAHLGGCEKRG